MDKATISGDIIASTSLSDKGRRIIEDALKNLLDELKIKFNVYGRVIKGDYLECYVPQTEQALRVALVIKSFVKSININKSGIANNDNRFKLFKMHGIRLAIGIGKLSRLDITEGIMDGEAIYNSGRIISESKTYNKEKVTIKNTLFLKSSNEELDNQFEPLLALIDVILSKSTSKQCEVLYFKLIGFDEKQIMKKLKVMQSTVNQHSTSVGWHAIEKAVTRFENVMLAKK